MILTLIDERHVSYEGGEIFNFIKIFNIINNIANY